MEVATLGWAIEADSDLSARSATKQERGDYEENIQS
jgi:hypothetical protein